MTKLSQASDVACNIRQRHDCFHARRLAIKTALLLVVEALLTLSMASAFHPAARAVLLQMGWSRARSPALPGARLRISDVAPTSAAVLWTWDELRERSGSVPDRVVIGDTIGGTQGLPGGLTLFRDRNGWCPYSERVWLARILKSNLYSDSIQELC